MHFPTLPRRWRSEANAKPPKYKNSNLKSLVRSASFSSDPPFKVPLVPPRRNKNCPSCSQSKSWKSQSLVDLQDEERPEKAKKASIFSGNLRSNSWRNLSLIGKHEPNVAPHVVISVPKVGGMNRSHRLSQGAKKVTPPSIPNFHNPRGSGSSFGSDLSYAEDAVNSHPMSTFSRAPNGESSSSSPAFTKLTFEADVIPRRGSHIPKEKTNKKLDQPDMASTNNEDQGIDMTLSPGRDSPGDESSASIATVESVSSGCRNSTTSLDSGRASNSNSNSTSDSAITTFHTIHEHRPMISIPPQPPRLSTLGSSSSSFRQSYHSSTSSLGSMDRTHEDSICALDIAEMFTNGVPDQEVLLAWLTDLHYEDYYDLFASAGYDMPTITKMTPEDLTAIGIKKPNHRKKLKAEIVKLQIADGLPNYIPATLDEFLHLVRLMEYRGLLASQGYLTIDDLTQISIEDLEDIGIFRLGHQKRLLLAIKRAKDLKSGRRIAQYPTANNIVRPAQHQKPPIHQQMSSFSQVHQPPRTPTKMENTYGQTRSQAGLVYQPEVIRIERAPSVSSMVRPPSCSPSPPPPPPPQQSTEVNLAGMPQPMPPLATTSFQRYKASFQYPQPPSWVNSGPRSFDDVDIALSNRSQERILMHQHSASNLTTSGGTLPRLGKGFMPSHKQRPVAMIPAKTREQQPASNSMNSLSDYDPKMQLKQDGASSTENFPFANDNVGTIRMRSNSHVAAMLESPDEDCNEGNDSNEPASQQQQQNKLQGNGNKSAGDVLNDIGSMLADLTDELDAMLHMDPAAHGGLPKA